MTDSVGLLVRGVLLDRDRAARRAGELRPSLLLAGEHPCLIDDRQLVPDVRNEIRGDVCDHPDEPGRWLSSLAAPAMSVGLLEIRHPVLARLPCRREGDLAADENTKRPHGVGDDLRVRPCWGWNWAAIRIGRIGPPGAGRMTMDLDPR